MVPKVPSMGSLIFNSWGIYRFLPEQSSARGFFFLGISPGCFYTFPFSQTGTGVGLARKQVGNRAQPFLRFGSGPTHVCSTPLKFGGGSSWETSPQGYEGLHRAAGILEIVSRGHVYQRAPLSRKKGAMLQRRHTQRSFR